MRRCFCLCLCVFFNVINFCSISTWRGYVTLLIFRYILKSSWISLRIDWILKIMVQFCYLRLYLGIVTVSCHLLQRMARMEMNWMNFSSFNAISAKLTLKNIMFHAAWWNLFDYLLHNSTGESSTRRRRFHSRSLLFAPLVPPKNQNTKQNKTKKQTKKMYFHFQVCWVHYEGERISGPSLLLDLVPRSLLFPSCWAITCERGCSTARKSSFSKGFIVTTSLCFLKCERIYHMIKLVPWWFRSS